MTELTMGQGRRYRIHSRKRRGAYFIFHASNLMLTQGRCLFAGGVYLKLGRDKEEERLRRCDFNDGAKLHLADLESGASHHGLVLCHTLVECEHLFGPSRK